MLDSGWYPDPTGRYEARFWDGRRWTAHVSHYGAVGTDPMRRARMESRLGVGVLTALRWLFTAGALGLLVWIGWRLWPGRDRDEDADVALAQAIGVQLADAPAEWVEVPTRPLGLLSEASLPAECDDLAGAADDLRGEPLARQAVATGDSTREIASTVVIASGDGQAQELVAAYREDTAAACLEAVFPQSLADATGGGATAGVELTSLEVRELPSPGLGDDSASWRIEGSTGGAIPVDVTVDLYVIRSGNRVVELAFRSIFNEMEASTQGAALTAVAARLEEPPELPEPGPGEDSGEDSGETPGAATPTAGTEATPGTPSAEEG